MNVGLGVPADGMRASCAGCGTTIIVRGAAPPGALRPLKDSGGVPELRMGSSNSGDLPAARESVPRPPTSGDDPNLPADIDLPDDLLASRGDSDDLSIDLPTPHARQPGGSPGVDLMDPQEINIGGSPRQSAAAAAADARATTSIPLGIDIFIGSMPAASASPLEPLELDLIPGTPEPPGPPPPSAPFPQAPSAAGPHPGLLSPTGQATANPTPPAPGLGPLKLRLGGGMPIGSAPPPSGAGAPDSGGPLDMAAMLSSLIGDAPPPPGAAPPSAGHPSLPSLAPPAAHPPLASLKSSAAPAPEAPRRKPAMAPSPGTGSFSIPTDTKTGAGDAMFSLKLDDGSASAVEEPVEETRPRAPLPKAAPAATTSRDDLPEGVAALAPPRRKNTAFVEDSPRPRSRRILYIAVGAVAAVVLATAVLLVLPRLRNGPSYAEALAPFEGDLARDHYPTYQKAAEAILADAGDTPDPAVRAAAAELLLLAALGRGGERGKVTRAEQLLANVPNAGEVSPEARRAHALLAIFKGKGRDAEQLVAAAAGSPEAQLIAGLRRLRERKPELAVAPLRGLADSAATRLLPRYLLGLALEESRQTAAALKAYERVLAGNREHSGAQVGKARLQQGPPQERRAAAEELARRINDKASPGELAEVQTLQGETTLALGRAAEAVEVLSRAVAASPGNASGQAFLAEALIADGRPADALTRLRAAENGVLTTYPARIAMAAALIANGQIAEGTSQIEALGPAASDNPRVPYWLGVASESSKPPDIEAAARRYRTAVDLDPRYLPASLRLAALLQKQGKADKALALIRDAEKAGVAPEALELAWGQALIAARNPQEAEAVFRKAVSRAPKLPAARIGLASALEEGGKLDEAEAELEKAANALKMPGLRDRLADLLLKRGKKQAALSAFEIELASGNTDPTMRVRLAKLALDMGKIDRAAHELELVTNESPGTPEAYFTLGRVREAGGDLHRALKEYRAALLYESFPQLHLALGRTLAALGKEDDALAHLGSAGDLAAARLERARIRLRRGRTDEALIDAEAAARLEPGNGQARFVHGLCLDLLGRADDAAAAWRTAIKVAPDLAEAYYRLGRYEMDKGRPGAALEPLRQAANRRPSAATWEADLYFQLALAELNGGSKPAAATALRRYLEVAPAEAPARPEAERMLGKLPRR